MTELSRESMSGNPTDCALLNGKTEHNDSGKINILETLF